MRRKSCINVAHWDDICNKKNNWHRKMSSLEIFSLHTMIRLSCSVPAAVGWKKLFLLCLRSNLGHICALEKWQEEMHYQETESHLNQNAKLTVFLPYNKTHCSVHQQPGLVSMGVPGILWNVKSSILKKKNIYMLDLAFIVALSFINQHIPWLCTGVCVCRRAHGYVWMNSYHR